MRRSEVINYIGSPSFRPQFENYAGGDAFIYRGVGYQRERTLGQGRFGKVILFKSVSYSQSHVVPLQPSYVVVKIEKGTIEKNRQLRYGDGFQFYSEAMWNQEIYDCGAFAGDRTQSDQPHAVLMKYIEGVTLDNITPKNMAETATIFIAVAAAIQYLHQMHSVAHGDIKLPNIIYGKDGKYYPVDFGLTERLGKETVGSYEVPPGRKIASFFPHIPPECFGDEMIAADTTQDIYALGYVLECLTICTLKNRGAVFQEVCEANYIVKLLQAIKPADRISIDRATSLLHIAFLSAVPHLPALVKEQTEAVEAAEAEEKMVPAPPRRSRVVSAPAASNRASLFVKLPPIALRGRAQPRPGLLNLPCWKF